jgi:hypothetical protein
MTSPCSGKQHVADVRALSRIASLSSHRYERWPSLNWGVSGAEIVASHGAADPNDWLLLR